MFRQIFSRINAKAIPQVRMITSTAAKQKSAYAQAHYPSSHAYRQTPSDLAVGAAGLVVIGFFGLQFWNCSVVADRIAKEDFHFEAFEHEKPTINRRL